MASGVHRYLVTAPTDSKMAMWLATGGFANWLEGRGNGDRETWLVTVFDENSAAFLQAGLAAGVTIEEIEGSGKTETYVLRVGKPGTGWQPPEGGGDRD